MLLKPTETFFDKDGEIVVVTRVEKINAWYYGKYCTGPKKDDDLEYGFGEFDIHMKYPRRVA